MHIERTLETFVATATTQFPMMLLVPYKCKGSDIQEIIQRRWNKPFDIDIVIKYHDIHVKLTHLREESNRLELITKYDDIAHFLNETDSIGIVREQVNIMKWEHERPLYIPLGIHLDRTQFEYEQLPIYNIVNEDIIGFHDGDVCL